GNLERECGSLSLTLDDAQQPEYARALGQFAQKQYEEYSRHSQSGGGTGLADRLHLDVADNSPTNTRTQWRNSLLGKLDKQAQPLLIYNTGMLHGTPPSEIKVIGAETRDDARSIVEAGVMETGDVSVVETNDPAAVTMLITHHGIPAHALSNFKEYRYYYEMFTTDYSATFHLDNERESTPHDPNSQYFVNFQDVEMCFARALAYRWIVRIKNRLDAQPDNADGAIFSTAPRYLFVLDRHLHRALKAVFDEQITELTNRVHQIDHDAAERRRAAGWTEFDARLLERQHKTLQDMRADLQRSLDNIIPIQANIPGFSVPDSRDYDARSLYTFRIGTRESPVYPATLDDMLAMIYRDRLQAMPALFVRAFERRYSEEVEVDNQDTERRRKRLTDLSSRIRVFLKKRNYDTDPVTRPQTAQKPTPIWGEPGQKAYALEKQIINLLIAQDRLHKRGTYAQRRDAIYFDPIEDDLNNRLEYAGEHNVNGDKDDMQYG
ncbi:MAG: hypothetical protein AAF787_21020, partial [Chloroflexota bacterium]